MAIRRDRFALYVFLASPDDLAEERALAREVVEELNSKFGSMLGCQIDLLVWEDLPPEAGRPQEIINRSVDDCDVFVGMLWKRWGSPTGTYSSGF